MAYKNTITHPSSAVHDIQMMSLDEIIEQYGIEINTDGSVWDTVEGKEFSTLTEWAIFTDELNNDELYDNFSKIDSKKWFDDD